MGEVSLTRRVMADRSAWTLPLRSLLRLGSAVYGAAVALRNRRYDRGSAVVSVEVPVISVGNITAGGTGKTPLVVEIARRLLDRGRKVAVLSRGYRAAAGQPADELLWVSRRLPGVVCMQDPDRVAAAHRAVSDHHVDAVVLDDAFQHRRLARDLDVVAVDATCPFGFDRLLPRGLLREPRHSLRRADLIVITRADQVDQVALESLHAALHETAPGVPCVSCRHQPVGLAEIDGSPARSADPNGRSVLCASGIGNPGAFEWTVRQMGADVRGHLVFADHHRYRVRDLVRIADEAKRRQADLVLTTEKDAVKLARASFDWPCRVAVVQIEIDFLATGSTMLDSVLDRVLGQGR